MKQYYIAFPERLKTKKKYGVNDIMVFTNSELVCNQKKCVYVFIKLENTI